MSVLFTWPSPRALTNAGAVMPGAKLHFYRTGTATRKDVYLDQTTLTAASNPVLADAYGRFPALWMDVSDGAYRVTHTDANDVQQWVVDGMDEPLELTQATIGAALYPRTAAEIAAGVTPTTAGYAFEPGDVRRYGAVGDGVTNDSTAISNALKVGLQGIAVYMASGTYLLTGWTEFAVTADLVIYGDGMELVTITGPNLTTNFLSTTAGVAIRNVGCTTWRAFVHVPDLTADVEHIKVERVKQTNSAYLVEKTRLSTETDKVKYLQVSDCHVDHSAVTATTQTHGIKLAGPYEKAVIRNNTLLNLNGNAIQLGDNYYAMQDLMSAAVIDGNHCEGMIAPTGVEAHGVLLYGREGIIRGNTVKDVQSPVDLADAEGIYTKCRFAVITANVLVNASDGEAAINVKGQPRGGTTAPQGWNVVVANNQVYFTTATTRNIGILVANESVLVESNHVEGAYIGIGTRDFLDIDYVTIKDNKIYNTLGNAAIECQAAGNRHSIIGNEIYGVIATTGAPANANGILVDIDDEAALAGLIIRGNVIVMGDEATSATGIHGLVIVTDDGGTPAASPITDCEISGNVLDVQHATAAERGINIRGTTTTSADFRIFDNDLSNVAANPLLISTIPSALWCRDNKGGNTSTRAGAGAVDVYFPITYITNSGAAAITLADGAEGQMKLLMCTAQTGTSTLTPTNLLGYSTIAFDAVGKTAALLFTNGNWTMVGGTATPT